jgi:hypothetical protein
MSKKTKRKSGDAKRLFELLGTPNESPPVNLEEARMLAEMEGSPVERRVGVRLDNECMKVCFSSESQAKSGAKHRLNSSANVGKLRAYFCDTCKSWHLTSQFIGRK